MSKAEKFTDAGVECYRHFLDELPYRAIVYVRHNGISPLYAVIGTEKSGQSAVNALRTAAKRHGAHCCYCEKAFAPESAEVTIDHAVPVAAGGAAELNNLLVACKPCNAKKGPQSLKDFAPGLYRRWINFQIGQLKDRLLRMD